MTEKTYNAIIIGAGLGGLTAGATLAKSGKKVLILEQHYIPGGCATTFKRKDYLMEVGLHEMDGLSENNSKVKIFDFLDINKHIELVQVPELYNIVYAGKHFTFPHGEVAAQTALSDRFPSDIKGINAFFKLLKGVNDETSRLPAKKLHIKLLYPLLPFLFPNVAKATLTTVGKWMDKHITNKELKLVLCANILYYSDDPYNMSMLYFMVAQGSYVLGGGHYIKGGSQNLSDYLASFIENNGGRVLLGKKVEQIVIENGKASGVTYHDTFNETVPLETVHADAIIANAAIPNVVHMLPKTHRYKLENKTKKLEEACSLISIYMGFDIDLKNFGVKHYSTFIQGDNVSNIKDLTSNYKGEWNNKGFVFVDYSQIDSGLTPTGKSFGVICAADYLSEWEHLSPEVYKQKKETIAQLFFQRLNKHFPGILNHLEYYEVGTAKTIQNYTLNYKGTPYGYAQSRKQSGIGRISEKSPIKNLYFASAWTFPGGGFTAAVVSGYRTANIMNNAIKWQHYPAGHEKDKRTVALLETRFIADNTIELVFEKPEDLQYKAGQYAMLRLNNPNQTEADLPFRPLSFVSHPKETLLRFAMRLSDSSFKQSCKTLLPGALATIYGPMGDFSIKNNPENICFLISGIGITPILPLLQELENDQFKGNVYLFYSNKTESSAAYHKELQKIALANFSYIPVETTISKRINGDLLKTHMSSLHHTTYLLVGTSSFLQGMKELLESENISKENIIEDDFG